MCVGVGAEGEAVADAPLNRELDEAEDRCLMI